MPSDNILDHAEGSLFFAIYPDAETAARIAQLAEGMRAELGLKGKPIGTDRLHVTLHFLGQHVGIPPDLVTPASEAAATVRMSPFEVTFDRAASFAERPRNRPFVLLEGGAGLAALRQSLGAALQDFGLGRWVKANYTQHLTLLYDDRGIAERPVEPIRWTAREFVLVKSLHGHGRHVPIRRWPLQSK